jgi:hypothetical protein
MFDLERVEETIHCTLHLNHFNPPMLKRVLTQGEFKEKNITFQANLKKIIKYRLISVERLEFLTDISFNTQEDLNEFLSKIHDYVFMGEPLSAVMDTLNKSQK